MADRKGLDCKMENERKRKHKRRKNTRRKKKSLLSKDELKAKRRRERRRIIIMERIAIAFFVIGVIGGGGFTVVWNLPTVKLSRQLSAGEEYTEEAAYSEAIEAYETALEIDSTSVEAYRCMAGAYLDMKDESHAKQVLYEGWENTQDESLLQYYCTVILNEAVEDINGGRVDFATVEKMMTVLDQGVLKEETLELMDTVYERLIESYKDAGEEATIDFAAYEQMMERLFTLYQGDKSEEVGAVVSKYGYLEMENLMLPAEHVDAYLSILEEADGMVQLPARSDLIACLHREKEVQEIFAGIFQEFDGGNYEAAKEFIVTDTYIGLRDAFINRSMEYWTGETYIPVSREYVKLKQSEGAWTFSFPDFNENETTAGVIIVWGVDMKDNGVLRTYISYEPAMEAGEYYPHTEYVISYMYSNLQKKNGFLYEMNYHFETRTWTEEGMTTHMIGDWGGPYQWEKTY